MSTKLPFVYNIRIEHTLDWGLTTGNTLKEELVNEAITGFKIKYPQLANFLDENLVNAYSEIDPSDGFYFTISLIEFIGKNGEVLDIEKENSDA